MTNDNKTLSVLCAGGALIAASLWISPASANVEGQGDGKPGVGKTEFRCLTEAVYFEARGEPASGQIAVAQVVLNRVDSPLFPDTICGVVYQNDHLPNRCQFSFACDGKEETMDESEAYADAVVAAKKAMACNPDCREEKGGVASSNFYHADYVAPNWAKKFERVGALGRHIFYYSASL